MLEIAAFYFFLLVLIILLLFILVLYSRSHVRILAPPLMNNFYGVSTATGIELTTSFKELELIDGSALNSSGGLSGGINFSDSSGTVPFSFTTLGGDTKRSIEGSVYLYAQSRGTSAHFTLDMIDKADNKVIAEETDFVLMPGSSLSLQSIRLIFETNETETNHDLVLRAKAREPTSTIHGTSILINSAYLTYI